MFDLVIAPNAEGDLTITLSVSESTGEQAPSDADGHLEGRKLVQL